MSVSILTDEYDIKNDVQQKCGTPFMVYVSNLTEENLNNVNVTLKIDEHFYVDSMFIVDPFTKQQEKVKNFDKNAKEILVPLNNIEGKKYKNIAVNLVANELPENKLLDKSYIYVTASSDDQKTVKSNTLEYTIKKPKLSITQTLDADSEINVDDYINFIFIVKNEGTCESGVFNFENPVPEGLVIENVKLITSTQQEADINEQEILKLHFSVKNKEAVKVILKCKVLSIKDKESFEIKNKAKLVSNLFGTIESNEISIRAKNQWLIDNNAYRRYIINRNNNLSEENNSKFQIKGNIWIDDNSNGIKEENENICSEEQVSLIDVETRTRSRKN